MPLTFPTHLFNPSSIKLELAGRVIQSPDSLSGIGQSIRTDGGGYWRGIMSGIDLIDPDTLRAWRAWEAELEGGAVECLIPIADIRHAPRPVAGGVLASPSQLAVTGTDPYFPEAVAFAVPFIIATGASAILRATQMAITVTQGSRTKGGQYFAINHATKGRRLYRTGRVLSQAGQTATIKITPPLREAISAATPLDFDWPSFKGVVIPDTDTAADIMNGNSSQVSIAFREAF